MPSSNWLCSDTCTDVLMRLIGDSMDPQILQLYAAGWSIGHVGRFLGISRDTVRRRLIHHKVKIRGKKYYRITRLPHAEFEQAIFLHHTCKLSVHQTAAIMGKAYSTIYRRLVYAGAPPRSPNEARAERYA